MSSKAGSGFTGEMRRRHEAIIRSGILRKVRSEGRLVFALALCWADYKTCQFRMSIRGAATTAGVEPTSIRRGLTQLLELGVIQAGPKEAGKRQRYRFATPQKSAHEPCTRGSLPVSSARTECDPYSSIVLKGSSRTREDENVLTGGSVPGGPDRLADSSEKRSEVA